MPMFYKTNARKLLGGIPVVGQWLSNPAFANKAKNLHPVPRFFLFIPGLSNLTAGVIGLSTGYKANKGFASVCGRMIAGFFVGLFLGVDNGIDASTEILPKKTLSNNGSFSNMLLVKWGLPRDAVAKPASNNNSISISTPSRNESSSKTESRSKTHIDEDSGFFGKPKQKQRNSKNNYNSEAEQGSRLGIGNV